MGRAAIRYAKAILGLAQEKNIAKEVQADMQQIITVIDNSVDLKGALASPLIKSEVKKATLLEVFKSSQELTKGLFDILLQNKRVDALQDVAKQYMVLWDQLNNTQVAKVTTAVPLTKELGDKVLAKVKELTGNTATLENTIDESIIGGFILRVGDLQYNASIANQLTTLKRALHN